MDPNKTLEELRRIVARILARANRPDFFEDESDDAPEADALRLAELVEALDGWLKNGGFLPRDWEQATEARRLIPGERIPTTNGVREVIAVNVDNGRQRVLVTVADPAGAAPDYTTTIGYALGQRVRVVKP